MSDALKSTIGLLWGFAFRDGRGARITNETADEQLATPYDWVWMHFALADHRGRRYLESFAPAPAAARVLLLSDESRLQLRHASDFAFGILPDIEQDFAGESLGVGRLAFYLDAQHLITVRHRPLRVVYEVSCEVEAGRHFASPADAFLHLNEHFVEVVEDRVVKLASALDHIEDVVLSDRDDIDPSGLGPVRRELSLYHREIGSWRSALVRATNEKSGTLSSPIAPHLRRMAQAAEDFDRDAAALADRARLLYEEMDTRIAAITNRSLRTLTILSTLLLPPTFIVGAFGMNLPSIPWANTHGGYWWATGLCVAVVALCWAGLKRFRIL